MNMMNKYIKQLLSLAAVALVSWGCEADFYNEHMIDGYEPETEITDVQSIDYTLTEDDYSTISKNKTNKTNAEAAGQEAVDALAAIGKNKYFSTPDEAAAYIPAFLSSAYPTLDNNSIVMVTYTTALDIPAEVAAMNAATEYTLSEDNYKAIWESEEDYVKAVTPATISKMKSVLPSEGMEAGQYVAVTYNYSAEEPQAEEPEQPENPDQPEDPVQPEVKFPGEGKYLIVALSETANYAVTPLAADKKYGYPTATEVTIAENAITADDTTNALAWTVTATSTEGEYTIQAPDARYYYLSGTYNSFNVSADAGTDGYGFTFTPNEDGTFAITNVTMTKSLQYDSNYSSFGCYPDIRGIVPHIFVLNEAGTAYVDVTAVGSSTPSTPTTPVYQQVSSFDGAGQYLLVSVTETANYAVTPLAADKKYGYPTATALTIENGQIAVDDASNAVAWTVAAASTEGQYTLQGTDGRYYYLSGSYNSFNVSDTAGTDGYGFTFTANGDGTFSVTNVTMSKTLQYDSNYSSFGCYPDSRGVYPTLFKLVGGETKAATAKAATVTSEKMYAYFKWNGTAFEDTEIVAVQPSDYTEMGQKYGNFTNPAQDQYLPKFLGKTYPYAVEGQVAYVAYRCYAGGATSWKVDEYVSDGTVWNKTIYFATKTDQFRKAEGAWAIDRTLELDYTGNGADTKAFYQYCVNWVYDNKDVPMGAPARDNAGVIISTDIVTINGEKPAGNFWVSNYGNNEFYTGASAYYGNIDWRASACKGGFAAAGMGDLTDDEIVEKLKENTAEVFAAVLGYVYPEMTPEEYKKVVIKVYAYGPNVNYAYTFNVVEKGTFAYAEGSMTEI